MLYLGPVIAEYESLKQDKKETMFIQIQQETDKYLFETQGCKFARIRTSPGLFDSRPLSGPDIQLNLTIPIESI